MDCLILWHICAYCGILACYAIKRAASERIGAIDTIRARCASSGVFVFSDCYTPLMSPLHFPGLLRLYLGLAQKLQPLTQADPSATVDAVNILTGLYSNIYTYVLQLLPALRVKRAAVNILHLAAPSVLQLAYICFTSDRLLKTEAFEPESTFVLLQASSLAKGLLPALWHKHPKFAGTSSRETTVWLEQQPATLAAIRSSFFSPGFRWFLWNVAASGTAGLHYQYDGVSPACGMGVPGDHVAFARPRGTTLLPAEGFAQMENYILDCMQFIHLIQPGEQVTTCLVSQQQQQQQQQQEEEEGAAVAGSIYFKEGRETWGLHSSSSARDDLDSSSRRDQDGTGSRAATISSSSSSGGGRSSSPHQRGREGPWDPLGLLGRRAGQGHRVWPWGRSVMFEHDKAQDNSESSSGSSDGIGDGSSKTSSARAGEGGGRGGGISGVGEAYDCRQGLKSGMGAEKKQGPTVEWLLLAAGSCTGGPAGPAGAAAAPSATTEKPSPAPRAGAPPPAAAAAGAAAAGAPPAAAAGAGVLPAAAAALPAPAAGATVGAAAAAPAAGATVGAAAAAAAGAGAPPAPAAGPSVAAGATVGAAAAGAPAAGATVGAAAAGAPPAPAAGATVGAAAAGAPPAPAAGATVGAGAAGAPPAPAVGPSVATAAPAGATVGAAAAGPSAAAGAPTASGASRRTEPEPEAALDVTANQLKLLLELLLLKWPCPQNQVYTMMGTVEVAATMSAHDWLLLLAALLQQAPAPAKLQLLEERGTLLLQLLYEVMLDEDSGGSRHPEVNTRTLSEYSSEQARVLLRQLAQAVRPQGQGDEPSSSIASSAGGSTTNSSSFRARSVKPVSLVLLVLQSLLYEAVPLSVLEEMPLLPGRMLSLGEYKRNWAFNTHPSVCV